MLRLFEILTGIGAVCAALLLIGAFGSGMSAPQQGAAAAMALGLVVIPYCVTGVLQRRALLSKRVDAQPKLGPLDF